MNTTTATINPTKLAQLEAGEIKLDASSHKSFEQGHCAMEVVAWLADQGHTDAPSCSSRVLRAFTIRLNDRWSTEDRQRLIPLLPRMIGTANDGQDEARAYLAVDWVARTCTPAWLDLAGLTEHAEKLRALTTITDEDTRKAARPVIREARDAARQARAAAAAAAAAYAAAAADAYAAAAAAAAAYADAAADADADAAADADAYAAADADAYAAAYAVADAVAVAKIKQTASYMRTSALELLHRMIDPSKAAA